jgi:cytoskeletal protein CcmA (bactofilin family)
MRDLTIKGDFTAAEDFTVDFEIEGQIELPGHRLVVTEGAVVRASVTAATVAVHGRLAGHVAADHVELGSTAVVDASLVAPRLRLHDGAKFTGPVNTDRAQAAGNIARHRQGPRKN